MHTRCRITPQFLQSSGQHFVDSKSRSTQPHTYPVDVNNSLHMVFWQALANVTVCYES